jgi:hypothetical protein
MAIYSPGNTGNPIRMLGSRFIRVNIPAAVYTFQVDAGIYYLSFQNVALRNNHLSADSGAYTIIGALSILNPGVSAASGSYVISGTAAGLKIKLNAAVGSYAISGSESGLDTEINAAVGSYSITGTDADLLHAVPGETLAVDSGEYLLTGTAAVLRPARLVTDDDGDYALTGTNATFVVTWIFHVDSGVYAISGQDTTLIDSGAAVDIHLLACMGIGG